MTTTQHPFAGVRGRITAPGDPEWDAARASWNLAVDQQPAFVVEAASADDVQAVVRAAAREGLRVAPQSTGHGSESLGPLDRAVLLKTSGLRAVSVDEGQHGAVARVEAGATAGEVADAVGAHGRAPVLGLAPTVGVAGLALGGGIGWLSRAYGLTANSVRAFEVVTAAGERLRVDGDHELFWALRGGGGRFAIVTALELDAHPLPGVFAGLAAWPAQRAPEVLEQFRRWSFEAPEALSPVFRYLALPPIEAIPEPLRGRKVVALLAAHLGTEADGERLTAPIREAEGKLIDTFGPIAPADLVRVAGDPDAPVPARGDGFMLDELSEDAVDAIGALIAEDALDPLTVFELRLLGGALARPADGHGALPRLEGAFSVFAGGAAVDAASSEAIAARLATLRDHLAPWTTPRALLSSSGGGVDPASAFDAATWARLERIRETWDPGRLIQPNHEPPAE